MGKIILSKRVSQNSVNTDIQHTFVYFNKTLEMMVNN